MLNTGISAILFYKNIKKGRYLFNMITKEITSNQAINNAYTELFDLADTILNAYIDKDTEDGSYKKFYDTNTNKIRIGNTFYEITPDIEEQIKAILDPKGDNNGAYDSEDAAEIYPGLFDEEGHIKINSLGEYFTVLGILTQIHPRFARIPLDEDLVTIDTNTRKIIMPKNNNVYAVKNDHAAETIYFIVDRYFDGMDLATAAIIVQSELNKNANISAVTKIDIDTYPGYIVFGWPISKLITAQSGSLKFAIRFYVEDTKKLVYSLGTLPQTLTIQPSFFNDGIPIVNDNTQPYIKNYPMSGTPNIVAPQLDNTNTTTPGVVSYNQSLKLAISGTTTAGSELQYIWTYYDGTNNPNNSNIIDYTELKQEEITSSNRVTMIDTNSAYKYYAVTGTGDSETWTPLKATEIPNPFSENTRYFRVDTRETKASKGGIYKGKIISTTGIFENKTETDNYFVSVPVKLKFKKENNNYTSSLQYQYFASNLDLTNSNNLNNFQLSSYINNEELYYESDMSGTKELYPQMTYRDQQNQQQWALTEPNASNKSGIQLNTTTNTSGDKAYKATINFTLNGITTSGTDSFTFDIVPTLKTINNLQKENIQVVETADKYTFNLSSENDPNSQLKELSLITRTVEVKEKTLTGDTYTLISVNNAVNKDKINSTWLNADGYQVIITDELMPNVNIKGVNDSITETSVSFNLKDLLNSSNSDSTEDSGT